MGRVTTSLCIGILLVASLSKSLAAPGDNSADALAMAQAWMAQIDAGLYDDSYTAGCVAFHEKVSADKWGSVLKTLRLPLGAVVNRKETSHVEKPDGFEGLDGECLVIKYETSFKNMAAAIEVVVVKREDGKWKGAGYNVLPKQATEPNPVPALQNQ
jgi:hypothetical protein